MSTKKLIIGITGATGTIYALHILKALQKIDCVESHLIISSSGLLNLKYELGFSRQDIMNLADYTYNIQDIGSRLASGSFETIGMIVVPCSMRTLSGIAQGFSDNLITRSADVTLKEKRTLIMMVREAPFNLIHLRNMISVTETGGIIFPPLPAFYHHPSSIEDMVNHTVGRVLNFFNIRVPILYWEGIKNKK